MRTAWLVFACACGHAAPPAPIESHVDAAPRLVVWRAQSKAELFAVAGGVVLAWDQGRDGVVERSATTGVERRFRKINGGTVNGTPETWLVANGGVVTGWGGGGDLTFLRDRGGDLNVAWTSGDDWWGAPYVIAGNTLWGPRARTHSALEAIDLDDGSTRWSTKFPTDAQDVKVGGDAATILLGRERYLVSPPNGPQDIRRVIAAYDAKSGAVRWETEIAEPNAIAVGSGGAIAAFDDGLLVFDGATGHSTRLPFHHAYPNLLVDRGIAYVVDHERDDIAAYRTTDGHVMWHRPHATGIGSRLEIRGERLYVSTSFGTVLALDRNTGSVAWEVGLGFVANKLFVDDTTVVTLDSYEAAGFVLPATAPAPEVATIHGVVKKVACGRLDSLRLEVGGHRVTPDATGRFTATVTATGFVLVTGPPQLTMRNALPNHAVIELTGRGDYATPDLEFNQCEID